MIQFALLPLQTDAEEFALDPTILLVSTAVILIISIGLGYWVYKDASKRDNNELLWSIGIGGLTFLTFIFGIVALVAYVIVRGDVTPDEPIEEQATGQEW